MLKRAACILLVLMSIQLSSKSLAAAVSVTLSSGTTWTGSLAASNARASSVVVKDNYAYVGCYGWGVRIFDIVDRKNPRLISGFPLPSGEVSDLTLQGNILYACDGPAGLFFIDVSKPGMPKQAGVYSQVNYARTARVAGNHAYLLDSRNNGLRALNISTLSNPQMEWYYLSGYTQTALTLSGDILTVLDEKPSFTFIDLTVPRTINIRAAVAAGEQIEVRNNKLYAVHGSAGFGFYY
jgi:hypothetical protein